MIKKLLLLSAVFISLTAFSQNFSNKGKDFWVGYGYHQVMGAGNGQDMVLYFATDQVTNIQITIPGTGFTQNITTAGGNSITTSSIMPKNGGQDARLMAEGVLNRGIHITSDKNMVAYAHIYNASVSGSCMLLPTPTLGKEYFSINYKNISNSANSNCWFYMVAVDTGTTQIEVTPSANTVGGWIAGNKYTVSLTQGQIYNVMGVLNGTSPSCAPAGSTFLGVDLTGSKIKSVSSNGDCKKIAVFSGSGRISITQNDCQSSSDNYMVQAFPKAAWGKNFLTSPTCGNTGNMCNNLFRICVSDPGTIVKVNGAVQGALVNNFYYAYGSTSQPLSITADQPITVAQYITSQGTYGNGASPGDPEMIYLSPLEQNISDVTFNSNVLIAATPHHHVANVIIPNTGTAISSFRIDGNVPSQAFNVHPQNPGYSYISINNLSQGIHRIRSDSGFNAIAFGYGNAESYGYNAGTYVKDLNQQLEVQTQYGIESTPSVCIGSPFVFKVYFPDSVLINAGPFAGTYQQLRFDSMKWSITPVVGISPNNFPVLVNGTVGSPATVAVDSINIRNGKKVAWYSLPTSYNIAASGTYSVTVTTFRGSGGECGGTADDDFDFTLEASLPPTADFTWTNNGCVTDTVRFSDATVTTKPTYKWWWDFGEPASGANNNSLIKNPKHKYAAAGTYTVRFSTITTPGCLSDTITKTITVTNVPVAKFGMSSPICAGAPVTFSDTSSAQAPGMLTKWNWDFGNGVIFTRNNASDTTITYNSWAPSVTDSLIVETNSGCKSPAFVRTFKVNSRPVSNFTLPAGICLPDGSATFPITSTNVDPAVQTFTYSWNYGDPLSGVNNTGTTNPGNHFYSPPITTPYNVRLITTTSAGCSDTTTKPLVNVFPQEHAGFTVNPANCLGTATVVTDNSVLNAGVNITTCYWDFGDASTGNGCNASHTYALPGTYTIKHWVFTDRGCNSDTVSQSITIHPVPAISSAVPTNPTTCLGNDGFITLNGLQFGQNYTVNYNKNAVAQPVLTLSGNASGQVVIPTLTAGSYSNINVTANNCTSPNAPTQVLTDPALPAAPTPGSNGPICAGLTLNLSASNVAGSPSYNWTGPNSFTAAVQNPSIVGATTAASGNYFVTVTVNNCTSLPSTALNVVVQEMPSISSAVGTNPTTCAGTNGFITISGLTPGNTYTVNYAKNAAAQPALTLTANGSGQVVIPNLASATYTNINCTINGCTSPNAPTVALSDPSAPAPPTTFSNSPICAGQTLNLNASFVTGGSYTWSGPNGFTSSSQTPSIPGATTAASGNYIVTVTVSNCTSTGSIPLAVTVNVTPAISSAVPTNPTTCSGNEGFITLNGLIAGQSYTVNYNKNAAAQPVLTLTANASGQVIIPTLTAGSYSNINLTANGCTSPNAATQVLTDPALPAAPTPGSNTPICAGSTLNLTATTLAGASGYNWTGPNSFTSAVQNPNIPAATTAASGNYFVTVTTNNCTSLPSAALPVVVNVMPVISSATITNPSTCSGSDGTITLSGLLPGQTYTVNYSKNAIAQTPLSLTASAGGTVVITNLTSGTYTNINVAANNCTSANAATQILSDPNPPAAPTANSNAPICAGLTLNLTASSGAANPTFTWTGPNGFTSGSATPSIPAATTAASGNYSVTVTSANCVSAATIIPVTINPLPTGNFNFTTPSCETRTITFTDASVANTGTVNSWAWSFGDPGSGPNNSSTLQNPTHTYAAAGNYTVTLTVTNSAGCTAVLFSRPVTINARPVTGFILPEVCLSDTYAQFTDTSKVAVGTTITGWDWNFGDANATVLNPNTSNVQNPQHSYTAVGNYNVQLIVTTNNGCKDTLVQVLTVNGSFPIAGFNVNNAASLCANDSVSIVNTSTVFPGTITKVEIYWDNVNFPAVFQLDNDPFPNKVYKHLYPNFQTPLVKPFTIRFRAYSGGICVNDRIQIINVNAAPKVQFNNIPNACLDAAPFQITQASEVGGVPGSFVFSGPGVSASGIFNPASVGPGTYLIRYTYTSTAGNCVDTASKQITVLAPPVADFTVSAVKCRNVAMTFTSAATTPTGTITTWTWDFGDATPQLITNSAAPVTHTYANAGNYNVTLRVTTNDGCVSPVKLIPVTVNPTPVASFSFPASVCIPNANVLFNNTSTIADGTENAFTYVWTFGDLSPNNFAKNPTHHYSAVGPFTVNLEVTSGAGCKHDTNIVMNNIHPQPKAAFSFNKPEVCIGDNVTLTDASDGKDGVVTQWNWALGDASLRTIPSFTYTYNTANTYNVSLYVVNSQGCNSDTLIKPFTVHPYPVVNAGPDKVVLEGGSVSLTPTVTGNDLQYLWTPSTYLNNSTSSSPVVSNMLADMTYTLTVTARGGCSRSDQVFVKLLKAPKIPNTFTPNNDGTNDFWTIEYLNTYPNNRVQVFTRTGQLVFESRGYNTPWNGTKDGKPLPFDTYYYIIEPNNGRKPITGYVTIVK